MKEEKRVIANNPKAYHDYFIDNTIECGIALVGPEVKSIRDGKVNLKDSFAMIKNSEIFLHNMHISPYKQGSFSNVDPMRTRKLLLHKKEIIKLSNQIAQKGVTLVPVSLYFNKNKVKLELAIARGKKLYDKRQDIAKKDAERRLLKHIDR
ncbi:MAG: SsrA-binding protein SmpB [Clostridia bacterium]|nr:SsrA-binding protein SmpB [Clostridia bacterium]